MAEIDAGIALKAAPPVFDPLTTVGKLQGLQSSILQNRLLGQEVEGKIARGRAAQGAIDQTTGHFDPDAFMRNLSATPQGAQFASEAAVLAQQQRLAQLQAQRESLGLSKEQGVMLSNGFMPFIQKYGTPDPKTGKPLAPTDQDFGNTLANIIHSMGAGADQNVITRAANLYKEAAGDPAKMMEAARNLALMGNPEHALGMLNGPVERTDRGPDILVNRVSPLTGQMDVSGVIPKGVDPATASSPVQVYNANTKQMEIRPRSQVVGTGEAGSGPTQPFAAGPALGEAQEVQAGITQAQGWRDAADRAPETKAQIKNLRDQVDRFTTGPTATWTYKANALGTMMGLPIKHLANETAAQEEFNKLAQQFINTNTSQLGEGTDSKLAASLKASPNEFMSKQGIKGVLALMEGQQDAVIVKNAAWDQWHAANPGGSAQTFMTQWNKLYNPRVFQAAHMSPEQIDVMKRGMAADERKTFDRQMVNAIKWRWITPDAR